MLASASGAIIIGFNVRPDPAARRAADNQGVDIRYYNVIYTLLDEVKAAMAGMLDPVFRDVTGGYAEVRQTFRLPTRDVVAGLRVLDGKSSAPTWCACCAMAWCCTTASSRRSSASRTTCAR